MPGEKKQNLTAALGRSGSRGPHRLPVPPSGTDCRWLWFGLGAKASQAQCCRWAYEGRGRSVSRSSLRELQVAVPWKCPRPNVPSAVFSSALRQAHRASTPSREQQQKLVPALPQSASALQGTVCCLGPPRSGPGPWFCGRRHIFRRYPLLLRHSAQSFPRVLEESPWAAERVPRMDPGFTPVTGACAVFPVRRLRGVPGFRVYRRCLITDL